MKKRTYGGFYPLHHAVNNIHEDVISVLLENGAEVLLTDDAGNTALHWAAAR